MIKIIKGDSLLLLKDLPSNSIDCIVTSPPYFGLRDYGVDGQIGSEVTLWLYLENLLAIFRECQRVLKKDGTCWVNIGDSYAGSGKGYGDKNPDKKNKARVRTLKPRHVPGIPRKSLMMIPERFALEMMRMGWILRNEIIWHKPNAMPASVKDRFTADFEKLYFFTKSPKYYFNQQYQELADSTRKDPRVKTGSYTTRRRDRDYPGVPQQGSGMLKAHEKGRNMRAVWSISTKPSKDAHFAVYPEELCRVPIRAGCREGGIVLDPFMGSGTTLGVAEQEGRNSIGCELSSEYIKIAQKKLIGMRRVGKVSHKSYKNK